MRISLISDEPIITIILEGFLSNLGYEVVSATSTGELLGNLTHSVQPADVIIADLHRPTDERLALIRQWRQHSPETCIVIVTGYDPITGYDPTLSPDEALAHGVYAYLRRPIYLGELELLLARLAERRANRRPPAANNCSAHTKEITS